MATPTDESPSDKGSGTVLPSFSDSPRVASTANVAFTYPTFTRLRDSAAEAVAKTELHNALTEQTRQETERKQEQRARRRTIKPKRHTHRDFSLEDAIDLIKQGYGPSAVASRTGREVTEIKEVCKERGIPF